MFRQGKSNQSKVGTTGTKTQPIKTGVGTKSERAGFTIQQSEHGSDVYSLIQTGFFSLTNLKVLLFCLTDINTTVSVILFLFFD